MNRKNSPQQRDRRSPKTRGSGRNSRLRTTHRVPRTDTPQAQPPKQAEPQLKDRLKATLVTIVVPVAITILILVGAALAGLMFTETSLVALPATVAQSWLALNLVPVSGERASVGILPLAPALLFGWVMARRVYRSVKDRVSMFELQLLALCTVGIPILLTLTAVAMLYDASSVLPVKPPSLGEAIVRTLVMHLCVLGCGMGPRLWRALARRIAIPGTIVDAALFALSYLKWLALAGAATVVISLAFHWQTLSELMRHFSTPGAAAGVVTLSLLYLPNAAMFAAAVLLGSEFHISDAAVSLFSAHLVPLPPMPLFAAVPASVVPWAWVLLVIPLVIAAVLAYRRMGNTDQPIAEFVAAGGFIMLFTAIAVYLGSGTLGAFGHVGSLVWLTSCLAALFLTGTSVLAVVVHRVLGPKFEEDAADAVESEDNIEEKTTREARRAKKAADAEPEAAAAGADSNAGADVADAADPDTEPDAEPDAGSAEDTAEDTAANSAEKPDADAEAGGDEPADSKDTTQGG